MPYLSSIPAILNSRNALLAELHAVGVRVKGSRLLSCPLHGGRPSPRIFYADLRGFMFSCPCCGEADLFDVRAIRIGKTADQLLCKYERKNRAIQEQEPRRRFVRIPTSSKESQHAI